jgi:hypothetical protein
MVGPDQRHTRELSTYCGAWSADLAEEHLSVTTVTENTSRIDLGYCHFLIGTASRMLYSSSGS